MYMLRKLDGHEAFECLQFNRQTCAAMQINPLPKLPVPLGIGHMIARFLAMRAGVSDLFIRGRLRITLKPLMSQLPVVGAVKVCNFQ